MNATEIPFEFEVGARQKAINDGALVDCSFWANYFGLSMPVALTAKAWYQYVGRPGRGDSFVETGKLTEIISVVIGRIKHRQLNVSEREDCSFKTLENQLLSLVSLLAVCERGDNGEPVLTLMVPEEVDGWGNSVERVMPAAVDGSSYEVRKDGAVFVRSRLAQQLGFGLQVLVTAAAWDKLVSPPGEPCHGEVGKFSDLLVGIHRECKYRPFSFLVLEGGTVEHKRFTVVNKPDANGESVLIITLPGEPRPSVALPN